MTDQQAVGDAAASGSETTVELRSSKESEGADASSADTDTVKREELGDGQSPNVPVSSAAISTAQKVFGGKSNAATDLKCSNLRSNPFSLGGDRLSTASSILAKPKFSLKPSSFGGGITDNHPVVPEGSDRAFFGIPPPNPFLRPATLNYDSDDQETQEQKSSADHKPTDTNSGPETENTSSNAPQGASQDIQSSSNGSASLLSTSPESLTVGQSLVAQNNLSQSSSSFVFGQGLDDRVTNVAKENGTSNGHVDSKKPKAKTLEEAADEYKKQQESGPLLPEVETKTGEEEESNVLQINCKLFLFQPDQKNWVERGRGLLRLNDDSEGKNSRVVMRSAGIHRVILNTGIWPSMLCERANQKSLRITGTGTESGTEGTHVYLLTGSVGDMDHLCSALHHRIQRMKQSTNQSATHADQPHSSSSPDNATKRKTSADDDDEALSKRSKQEGEVMPECSS